MALSLVQTAWSGIQSDPDMQAAVAECASLMRKLGGVDTRVVCEHDPLVMEERLASAAWPLQIRGH